MTKHKIFTHWLPLLLWLVLIFVLSHQVKDETEQTSGLILSILQALGLTTEMIEQYHIHFFVRKLAHFTEYFVLFFLLFRLLKHKQSLKKAFASSWVLAVLYACLDEWHQSFIPGRGAALTDIGIDACGAAVAAFISSYFLNRNNQKNS